MKHFFCYIENGGIDVGQITDRDILLFFNEASLVNSSSMGRVLRTLKLVTAYLKENNICRLNLDYSMMSVKRGRDRCIAPYSPDEAVSVLTVIDRSSEIGARDYAIILLALGTGLRGCDIAGLRKDEIDWHGCSVSVIQKKTGNSLHLPIGGETMNAIADYILKFRPESTEPYVFLTADRPPRALNRCTLYKRLKKYKALAGVTARNRQGFHSLRRTFATGLSSSGVDISVISSLMGHRGIDEDRPYLSYNDEQMAFVAMGCASVPFSGKYYSDCNPAQTCTGGGGNDVL
ncbi:MAG: tyrosine-type recombinase/integrase [Lachnospiraceae bacterium]|nr:tyrosine-type recombinase/integrase [Lachnospiraceae bacterium]